jgi:hypothetical protein
MAWNGGTAVAWAAASITSSVSRLNNRSDTGEDDIRPCTELVIEETLETRSERDER